MADGSVGYVEPASPTKRLRTRLNADGSHDQYVALSDLATLATEVKLEAVRALLAATLTVGGTVALDAASLAALEATTVTVTNPTANPETGLAKEATLATALPRDVTDRAARSLGHVTVDNSDARDQSEAFRRLLKFEPLAGEVLRREETTSYDYHGAAPAGTLDTALAWKVVRFDRSVSGLLEVRYRSAIAWADRTVGW